MKSAYYYLVCLLKNKFTRFSAFSFITALLLEHYNHPILGIVVAAPGAMVFALAGFGCNSYYHFGRYYKLMVNRGSFSPLPKAYCSKIGFLVACNRVARTHPELWEQLEPAIHQALSEQALLNFAMKIIDKIIESEED